MVNVVEKETCSDAETCPDGFKLFNTNLVFDRNGCIISRYRKFNLFIEPNMNVTKVPEIATFETDFGVTFGHFICFDILFKSPALDLVAMNVSHILYPSMWYSETPFLTSIQIQQSFAQRNNIALLSSGTNSPLNSNTGSGIFVGRHGAVDKIISYKNESRMMVAEIPKDVDDLDYEPPAPTVEPYAALEMDALHLWNFSPKNLFPLHKRLVASFGGVTCEFALNYTKLEIPEGSVGYGYKLTVYSGVRTFSNIVNAGEIYCAIVPCADENDEKTCGKRIANSNDLVPSVAFHSIEIKVTVDADAKNFLVMPTSLDAALLPLSTKQFEFKHHEADDAQKYSIKSIGELSNLMTFGIYGRNYNLDGPVSHVKTEENSSNELATDDEGEENFLADDDDDDNDLKIKMTIYIVLMVVLSVITSIMVYRKLQHPYIKPDLNKRKSYG